jgi:hypothetical protein
MKDARSEEAGVKIDDFFGSQHSRSTRAWGSIAPEECARNRWRKSSVEGRPLTPSHFTSSPVAAFDISCPLLLDRLYMLLHQFIRLNNLYFFINLEYLPYIIEPRFPGVPVPRQFRLFNLGLL